MAKEVIGMNRQVVEFLNTGKKEYDELGYVETIAICSMPIKDPSGEAMLYSSLDEFFSSEYNKSRRSSGVYYIKDLTNSGQFILDYLRDEKYEYSREKYLDKKGQYNVIMSTGVIYQIKMLVNEKPRRFLNFYDIDKLVPLKIKDMNSGFNLNVRDYDRSDIRNESNLSIMIKNTAEYAKVMRYMIEMDLAGTTLSSRAFSSLIKNTERYNFKYRATKEEEYDFIHSAYDAGYNDMNNIYRGKELGKVISLDVNSMFPSILRDNLLPYGDGVFYTGEFKATDLYPLFIQRIKIDSAVVKYGKTAMINPYEGAMKSMGKYIDDIDQPMEMTMSSIMLEVFLENYHVYGLEFLDGYKYHAVEGSFKKFIDKWMDIKVEADRQGDVAMRTISKMVMNYSYGGFGKRRMRTTTYIGKDGYESEPVEAQNRYMPVAVFITSYAIQQLVEIKNEVGDRFIYADVDSVHLIGHEIPEIIAQKIHSDKLGYWKIDGKFDRAKFLKLKTYVEESSSDIVIRTAGAGDEVKDQITFDNFNYGTEYEGMLRSRKVKGGAFKESYTYKL